MVSVRVTQTLGRGGCSIFCRWLADCVDYRTVKYLYIIRDGHEELKGVRIGDEFARIGDTIVYDGKRSLSIERR